VNDGGRSPVHSDEEPTIEADKALIELYQKQKGEQVVEEPKLEKSETVSLNNEEPIENTTTAKRKEKEKPIEPVNKKKQRLNQFTTTTKKQVQETSSSKSVDVAKDKPKQKEKQTQKQNLLSFDFEDQE
jgi:hypothetical protein